MAGEEWEYEQQLERQREQQIRAEERAAVLREVDTLIYNAIMLDAGDMEKNVLRNMRDAVSALRASPAPAPPAKDAERDAQWLAALVAEHGEWSWCSSMGPRASLDNVAERMGLGEEFAARLAVLPAPDPEAGR